MFLFFSFQFQLISIHIHSRLCIRIRIYHSYLYRAKKSNYIPGVPGRIDRMSDGVSRHMPEVSAI